MKMLLKGPTLIIHPSLAVKIGLHEAIFLQQLHYKLQFSQKRLNGCTWYQCTIDEWLLQLPFLSRRTLERTVQSLYKMGLIEKERFNSNGIYYRIRYGPLQELLIVDNTPNRREPHSDSNHAPTCHTTISQNGALNMSHRRIGMAENADTSMTADALRIKERKIKETKDVLLYAKANGGQWGVDEGQVFEAVYEVVKNSSDISKLLKEVRKACQQHRTLYPEEVFRTIHA